MGSAYANGAEDPFAVQASLPSVKFPTIGAEADMYIIEVGELRQALDYTTGEPQLSKSGKPRMQLRIIVDVNGEEQALYVKQYSNMWKAIAQAKGTAPLTPGGRLWVKYVGDVPVEGAPHLKAKGFAAKYAPIAADPFVGGESPQTTLAKRAEATPESAPF